MKKIFEIFGYILRYIEVFLCLRKSPYKTHTFKRNVNSDYYHNKAKWKQPYEFCPSASIKI